MLRDFLSQLDERYPQLSRWLGGRLETQLPALGLSTFVHLALLLTLAMVGYAAHSEMRAQNFDSRLVDTAVGDSLEHLQFQDIDQPDTPTTTPVAGSFSTNLAPMTVAASSAETKVAAAGVSSDIGTGAARMPNLGAMEVREATRAAVPTAMTYGDTVSIRGSGAEHVGGVEGAVDRIADEILRRLEKNRTLVVWAFDASGSLQAERERLSKHIDTVYSHITQRDENSLSADGGLLTTVVAFGNDRRAMTEHPTADKSEIIEAINAVPLDTTGVETTFGTVAEVIRKWGRYKDAQGRVYHPMVIVVTDEVGDDDNRLEEAVETAVKAKVPVYVLGSQAIFGRDMGFMNYTDPKTKQTFYNLPVKQGPESVMIEQIRLPFWYTGYQYDMLNSGFGPWALSRLASATGGIYFITRLGENRMGFDPVLMREYKPDWISRAQYEAGVVKNGFRASIINAAMITQQKLPGTPPLNFPPADSQEFKDAMRDGQVVVERTEYTVNEALEPISNKSVIKARDREPSRRWQANYDLTRGRLLAMKVRCHEYNWLCAKMKRDPQKFKNSTSNAWKLVPDEEIKSSDQAAKVAAEAKKLLEGVRKNHPGTPWALFAERELKDAFGFKWVETVVKPPPPRNNNPAADAAKKKAKPGPMTKPPEPPKL